MDANKQSFSLDQFLDKDIDALPDMPTRELLPAGKHVLKIKNASTAKLGDKNALKIEYIHQSTEELANPQDENPKPGTEYEEVFFTDTEMGLGALKEYFKNVKQPGVTLGQLIPALVGQDFRLVSRVRKWKDKQSGEQREGWQTVGGIQFLNQS